MLTTSLSKAFSAMLILSASHSISAATIQELNTMDEYNKARSQSGPMVIAYNSSTCGACKPMEESLAKAAQSSSKIRFYKLDLTKKDAGKEVFEGLGKKVGIQAYPTTEFIEPGKKSRLERGSMGFDEVDEIVYEMENGKKRPMKNVAKAKA